MKGYQLLSVGLLAALLLQTAACASPSAPPLESDGVAAAPAFTDVPADAWYAQAVLYCREQGLVRGTAEHTFSPDRSMTRSMLAAVLYRLAGSPAVSAAPVGAREKKCIKSKGARQNGQLPSHSHCAPVHTLARQSVPPLKGRIPTQKRRQGRRFCVGMTVTIVLRVFYNEPYPASSPYGLRFVSMPP
ncbi:S-layer homology domain-containing protein [Pseudoflavonifractor phocaeensis]|uniref:S-layer homology domain-containing protein n=1 Tax=Pseudoflavonifractor phocaeensis TaxID=1870988 RepID=UPI00210E26D3|nr:S-layer homology domain-containing protein [Pseudoflavonifractor phocaeensis]MCQ4862774.1 S-layer homology domain-containing protein [Pseudoflavonifractor phocaeensis]